MQSTATVAIVTFSESDSAPVSKFLNRISFRIRESYSNSGSHGSNWEFTHVLLTKLWRRFLLLQKLKRDYGSGYGFLQIFDSGSERKTQYPYGVGSGTLVPWPVDHLYHFTAEVDGVTFSNSDSVPVPIFLKPDPEISKCHRSNRNIPMFLLRNDHNDSCNYRKWKVTLDPVPVFNKFFTAAHTGF